MSRGVDIRSYPADQFLSIIEYLYIRDYLEQYEDSDAETRKQAKQTLKAEFIKYNRKHHPERDDEAKDAEPPPVTYLEPNEDGYYPGLEDGLLA